MFLTREKEKSGKLFSRELRLFCKSSKQVWGNTSHCGQKQKKRVSYFVKSSKQVGEDTSPGRQKKKKRPRKREGNRKSSGHRDGVEDRETSKTDRMFGYPK